MFALAPVFQRIIVEGTLEVTDASGKQHRYGDGTGTPVRVRFNDNATPWRMIFRPSMGLGEGYMNGRVDMIDGHIYDFIELLGRNMRRGRMPPFEVLREGISGLFRRLMQLNPAGRSKNNVAHHYDLKPELFELFLDRDRQYSCAYFDSLADDVDRAQENKKRHLAAKLQIRDGHKVLDIGCGWGGLGLYIARRYDVHVTGITLSEEQHVVANERAKAERLAGRASFELRDYRAQTGTFDRIVSVGMFEHVGFPQYPTFFAKVKELLAEDGVMLLHTIGRSGPPGVTDSWIRKYIFPGGYIPALSEIMPRIEKAGLVATDVEFLGPHYAETLRCWRERFEAGRAKVKAMYDERFCRMWEFYIAGSEVAFRHMGMTLFQIQMVKNRESLPMTRSYIAETEAALDTATRN